MTGGLALTVPTMADAAAISRIAQESFRQTFAYRDYPPADLAAFLDGAMGEGRYAAQLADPAFALRVARRADGGLAGFIKGGPNELPMPEGEPPPEQTWELHQLYLLPEAQGSGIADTMMAWLDSEARARGARALYLSVYVENLRAQRFYARHCFIEIGRNPFPVGDTIDDDRVWRKWL